MRVSYGIIFFISILMGLATIGLIFLYIKPIRHLVMGICKKYHIG